MGKIIKKTLCFGLVSFLLYIFFRLYLKIRAAVNLNSSLPEYIKNVYEEEVEVDITIALKKLTINLKGSKELREKGKMIVKTVENYLVDFYPELNLKYITVNLEEKVVSEES